MAQPPFYLQISDASGAVIRTRCGGKHEADLVDLLVTTIMARGVGLFRSASHVERDIRAGVEAALHGIKVQDPFDVEHS